MSPKSRLELFHKIQNCKKIEKNEESVMYSSDFLSGEA